MKNKRRILLGMVLVFLGSLFFILPAVQAQSSKTFLATGETKLSGMLAIGVSMPTTATTGLSEKSVAEILNKFLGWLLGIAGIIALIGFAVSGIMYLVSTGNDEMITMAKKYMMYCLIGVVVILSSFVIIKTINTILNVSESTSSNGDISSPVWTDVN